MQYDKLFITLQEIIVYLFVIFPSWVSIAYYTGNPRCW